MSPGANGLWILMSHLSSNNPDFTGSGPFEHTDAGFLWALRDVSAVLTDSPAIVLGLPPCHPAPLVATPAPPPPSKAASRSSPSA